MSRRVDGPEKMVGFSRSAATCALTMSLTHSEAALELPSSIATVVWFASLSWITILDLRMQARRQGTRTCFSRKGPGQPRGDGHVRETARTQFAVCLSIGPAGASPAPKPTLTALS
jgi:hypothetical protein